MPTMNLDERSCKAYTWTMSDVHWACKVCKGLYDQPFVACSYFYVNIFNHSAIEKTLSLQNFYVYRLYALF